MIYFRIQVFGSRFLQFGHLHFVGLVDFNWAEAWIIVNGLLLDTPVSNEVYAVGDITNLTFQQVGRSHHNLFRRSEGYWMLRHRLLLNIFFFKTRNPSKTGHFVCPPMSGKPRTRIKYLLHTYWKILRLCQRASPKNLFAPKGI